LADIESLRKQVAAFDDGEITTQDRTYPFNVVPPLANSKSVLYTTKFHSLRRFSESLETGPPCGVLARYGMPEIEHISWISAFVNDRTLLFLGDCDPFDLIVFSALASVFEIEYLGVSDRLLKLMDVDIDHHLTIPLESGEAAALELILEKSDRMQTLVGPNCYAMLKEGRKMEIEAVVSFARQPLCRLFELIP
jgi:hypothetical protein